MVRKLTAPPGARGYKRSPAKPSWTIVVKSHVGRKILELHDAWWAAYNALFDNQEGPARRDMPTKAQMREYQALVEIAKAHGLGTASLEAVARQNNLTKAEFDAVKKVMAEISTLNDVPQEVVSKALQKGSAEEDALDLTQKRDLRTIITVGRGLKLDMSEVEALREKDELTVGQYQRLKVSINHFSKLRENFQHRLNGSVGDSAFRLRSEVTETYVRGSVIKSRRSASVGFVVQPELERRANQKSEETGVVRNQVLSMAAELGYEDITVEGLMEVFPGVQPSVSLITQLALNMGLDVVAKDLKAPEPGRKDNRARTGAAAAKKLKSRTGKKSRPRHAALDSE